jgi:8-amino-7-oxononanoate synthase
MNNAEQYLRKKLDERLANGNRRQLPVDRVGVDFSSNDYLGFAKNGLLLSGKYDGAATGSTGSRLISGNSIFTEEAEALIAQFHKAEAALLFNSGYDANIGLLSAIASKDTVFLYDELCHASIIDGIRLSICRHKYRYRHNDLLHLEELLQKHSTAQVYVVTESVFSMDGDMAMLAEMATVCERHNAQLIVDEAHATGVVGPNGRGSVCALGIAEKTFARVHTFGKALGCHGAAVVGSSLLRQYLVNFARSFIYTTALPPHSVQVIREAYSCLTDTQFSNANLHQNIAYFRHRAEAQKLRGLIESTTPIQAIVIGGNEATKNLANTLQSEGLLVNAILHPTVAEGMERLRICLHAFNKKQEIDTLINLIGQWQKTQ